jgi:hypothetical protein
MANRQDRANIRARAAQTHATQERILKILLMSSRNDQDHEALSSIRIFWRELDKSKFSPSDIHFGPSVDFLTFTNATDKSTKELRGEIDFLRKHVPASALATAVATRDWAELIDLAEDKLGPHWRKLIQKKLEITKRRFELWETLRAVIPEQAFADLRRMPNNMEPDDPQPATSAGPPAMIFGDDDPISIQSARSNSLKVMTEADLSAQAHRYVGDLDHQIQSATERFGLPFGRIAIELTNRFKARPRKRGDETQKVYLGWKAQTRENAR